MIEAKVSFFPEYDANLYRIELDQSIKRFLSPWAFEVGKDITIGGRIRSSDLLAFIENQQYVDYVVGFKLFHVFSGDRCEGIDYMEIENDFIIWEPPQPAIETPTPASGMQIGTTFVVGSPTELAIASTAKSVLVTATEHRIEIIEPGDHSYCVSGKFGGIGFWGIEIDFEVTLSDN